VIDGVLNINKPAGWTSHDVVQKVRGILREKRVGHTGTLDPLATGVLVLCVGRATRIARYLEATDKEYRGTMRLGVVTDTLDADGTVLERRDYTPPREEEIRRAMERFTGDILQRPPIYSAVKVSGVPSYRLARRGQAKPLEPRQVTVFSLELTGYDDPLIHFKVSCSKGTYVRTICSDLGEELGTGGHLLNLERTRVGAFTVERAFTLDGLSALAAEAGRDKALTPIDAALGDMPALTVGERESLRLMHGNAVPVLSLPGEMTGIPLRVRDETGRLLAIGSVQEGKLRPEVVF
jgi:tRNA pseudouridine55 synthase